MEVIGRQELNHFSSRALNRALELIMGQHVVVTVAKLKQYEVKGIPEW